MACLRHIRRCVSLVAGLAALAALAPSGGPGGAAAAHAALADAPAPPRFFAPGSFWNRALDGSAPLDARSGAYVGELIRQVKAHDPWINTTRFSTPVYTVPAAQPTVRVALDTGNAPLQKAWEAVPIPPEARAAAGTDGHLVVHQPSTDTMWEFWKAGLNAAGWHARWGGRITQVSRSPGYFRAADASWGATATSLPLAGGLMTLEELRRGRIGHALAFAIPSTRARDFSWPAQRTDGNVYGDRAIPEGARFRLDPSLDLDALDLPPMIRMMAEAVQRYGMVLRDKAGVVVFYGEDPSPTAGDPWRGAAGHFGGQYPNRLLERFPWSRLQALKTRMRCCWTVGQPPAGPRYGDRDHGSRGLGRRRHP